MYVILYLPEFVMKSVLCGGLENCVFVMEQSHGRAHINI
jgi:hypothetical protein